jgi:hypothetical protein
MKYGYLEFRYNNRRSFEALLGEESDVTINIGDNIQSLAIRALLNRLGIGNPDIVGINRDDLASYDGEPVMLVMNGCFYPHCFPLPPNITPLFFGFNTNSVELVRKHKATFKRHEPIGCRDTATKQLLLKHGISAYVTGCLTLTLDKRSGPPENGKVVISYGRGSGEFPGSLLQYIPPALLQGVAFIFQRQIVNVMPLGKAEVEAADRVARKHLDFYAREASLVITPLLHVASPCMGMGIPVILARKDLDARFSAISRLTPVHTPMNFQSINWSPETVDLEPVKRAMTAIMTELVQGNPAGRADIEFLSQIYHSDPVPTGGPSNSRSKREKSRSWLYRFLHLYWLR